MGKVKFLSSFRINKRNDAKIMLQKLNNVNGKVLVIHYSCESFYGKAGYTPRVTSIGILNKENNEAIIFSLHLTGQIMRKDIANLSAAELDEVERVMLDEFARYVQNHTNYLWIHWNMRSASYGFQAISNRYRILGGNELYIPDANKIDLCGVFGLLLTYNFEEDKPSGQMLNLAERNKISRRDALVGADEAVAYEEKEYQKLHMSTLRKIEIIDRLLLAYQSGKLKHNATLFDIYDLSLFGIIALVKESWILLFIWSIIILIISALLQAVIPKFFGVIP